MTSSSTQIGHIIMRKAVLISSFPKPESHASDELHLIAGLLALKAMLIYAHVFMTIVVLISI